MIKPIENPFRAVEADNVSKNHWSGILTFFKLPVILCMLLLLGAVVTDQSWAKTYYIIASDGETIDSDAGFVTNLPNKNKNDGHENHPFFTSDPSDDTTQIRDTVNDDGSYHIWLGVRG